MRRILSARLSVLFVLILLNSLFAFAQGSKMTVDPDKDQQEEIEKDDPAGRVAWFMKGRTPKDGSLPATMLHRAYGQKMQFRANFANRLRAMQISGAQPNATIPVANGTAVWAPMGPGPMVDDNLLGQNYGPNAGRITAVAANPGDPTGNTVIVGAAYGGVWISENAAATDPTKVFWRPLLDQQTTLAIGSVSWSPNGSVILVGSGEGNSAIDSYYGQGIFRSIDFGQTWTQITSSADGHSFLGLGMQRQAWSKTTPSVVALATTFASRLEGANSVSSRQGLYYSTDSGASWRLARFFDGANEITSAGSSNSVAWNPVNHKFYAHYRFHGIYVSRNPDDPSIFDRLANQPDTGGINTLANCPVDPNGATCPIQRAEIAIHPTRNEMYVWWIDPITSPTGVILSKGIWKSLDGGASWTKLVDTNFITCGDSAGCGPTQAFYNMTVLAVSNPTTSAQTDVYVGGVNLYKCTIDNAAVGNNATCGSPTADSPFSFKNLTHVYGCSSVTASIANVHPDQHDMYAVPGTRIIYFGHDGGISRALDSSLLNTGICDDTNNTKRNAFDNLNSNMGALTQWIWGTAIPDDPLGMLAGSQDNGSAAVFNGLTPSNGQTWKQVNGGDGGYNDIDPSNPLVWYTANTGVSVQKSSVGKNSNRNSWGADIVTKASVGGDESAFYTPYLLDPQLSTKILVGTCRIWRGPNSAWGTTLGAAISPKFSNISGQTTCGTADSSISAIGVGGTLVNGTGSKAIYAGLNDGTIFRTLDSTVASPTWTNVSPVAFNPAPPNGFAVSSIAVDPTVTSGQTAYLTLQGFGVAHVLKTINGGTNWTAIGTVANGLPDSPANHIVIDPDDHNVLYVGTDVGVFSFDQSLVTPTWIEVGPASSTGNAGFLPNVPVYRVIRQNITASGRKLLKAVTYGRGVWVADITPIGTAGLTFTPASPVAFGTVVFPSSSTKTITVTNNGTAALIVSNAVLSDTNNWGVDSISCGDLPATVQQGGSCQIAISFHPQSNGALTATLTLTDNTATGTHVITFNGTGSGAPASIQVAPTTLPFADQQVGTTSAALPVTITNNGTNSVTVSAATVSGQYQKSGDTCTGTPVAGGGNCTIQVQFKPTSSGLQTGTLTITSNATGSPHTVNLTGTAIQGGAGLQFTVLNFPNTMIGGQSATQTDTLTNNGTAPLTITSIIINGTNPASFNQTNDCPIAPATLAKLATCTITVKFTPQAVGALTANVSITDDGPGSPQTITLNGTGTGSTYTAAPNPLAFGTVAIGSPSTLFVTINNTGTGQMTLAPSIPAGMFTLNGGTCGATLNSLANCTIGVKFTPTNSTPQNINLSLNSNGSGPATVALTGTGTNAPLSANPSPVAFGNLLINTLSGTTTVTIANISTSSQTIGAVSLGGTNPTQFQLTDACSAQVLATQNSTCTFDVRFQPTSVGAKSATVTVPFNGGAGTVTVNLTGTGTAPTISPAPATTLNFPAQKVGTTSTAQNVTLTNTGTADLHITALATTAPFAAALNTCGPLPKTLTANASCVAQVTYSPAAAGAAPATNLVITSDSGGTVGTATNIALTGTGENPAYTTNPTAGGGVAFNGKPITTSSTSTVTLTNTSHVPLAISSITATGTGFSQTNTCGTSLAGQANCNITVTFNPTTTGAKNGQLTINSDASSPGTSVVIGLSGTGEDFAQSVSSNSATVTAGASASFTFTETPAGGNFTNAITFSCSGLDATMGCSFNPAQITPGAAAATTTMTVTTRQATGTAPAIQRTGLHRNGALLAFLFALPGMAVLVPVVGKRKMSWKKKVGLMLLMLVVLTMVLSMSGCGGNSGGTPGTKPGPYNLTVTASSGTLQHTTNVTVNVQ